MTPDRATVTAWLIDLLKSAPGSFRVGDGVAPEGGYPYAVVHSIDGGGFTGPGLGAQIADATFVYQVDSVGQTRAQAEKLASRMRNAVAGRLASGQYAVAANNPTGHKVLDRVPDGVSGAAVVEGTPPHEVFTVSERFAISVTTQ